MIHHSKLGLSGMVLKKKRELVLEKESTMKISTKRKGVCGTHERRRKRRRVREKERVKREYREME